jgi:hypothetical protein
MKLKELKKNFFQIPEYDLEFHGPKTPYEYFNIINEKCEKKSFFIGPVLDGELLRVDPLEYRFITHAFPNERVHDSWKTRIDIKIERISKGSVFQVKPRAGFAIWFFSLMALLSAFSALIQFVFTYKIWGINLVFILLAIVIYFIERVNVRRLIDKLKKEVL